MNARADIVAACAAGDEGGIDRAGWSGVLRALRWWTKPGRVTLEGTVAPIADGIGDEDPERIVAALRTLLDDGLEWRPSAAQILAVLHAPSDPAPERRHRGRPDLQPAALQAVRLAAAAGAGVCECVPRSPQMNINPDGVLSCPDCGGLEPGQYDTALESPSLGETAA